MNHQDRSRAASPLARWYEDLPGDYEYSVLVGTSNYDYIDGDYLSSVPPIMTTSKSKNNDALSSIPFGVMAMMPAFLGTEMDEINTFPGKESPKRNKSNVSALKTTSKKWSRNFRSETLTLTIKEPGELARKLSSVMKNLEFEKRQRFLDNSVKVVRIQSIRFNFKGSGKEHTQFDFDDGQDILFNQDIAALQHFVAWVKGSVQKVKIQCVQDDHFQNSISRKLRYIRHGFAPFLNALHDQIKDISINSCALKNSDLQSFIWSSFVNLEELNLAKNYIKSLSFLSEMHNIELETLVLSENDDIKNIVPVAFITTLKKLDLSSLHMITDVSPLASNSKLEEFNMICALELSDVSGLKELKSLKILRLSQCQNLHDIDALSSLESLEILDLDRLGTISDLTPLKMMTQMKELDLSGNNIRDLSPLMQMKHLEVLLVTNNEIVDISPLIELRHLEKLDLDGNKIEDVDLFMAMQSQLKELDISDNEKIIRIDSLTNMKSLRVLKLHHNPQIIDYSTSLMRMTQLISLDLADNQLVDVSFLSSMEHLEWLDLQTNSIVDITPLVNLKKLSELCLSENQIENINQLNEMPRLLKLRLNDNHIDDISGLDAMKFPFLEVLDISNNDVVDIMPLKNLKQLRFLYIGANDIVDVSPITELTQLFVLYDDREGDRQNPFADRTPLINLCRFGVNVQRADGKYFEW